MSNTLHTCWCMVKVFSFAHPWRIEREHCCAMNTLAGMVKASCRAVKSKRERLSWFGPQPMGWCLGLILHLCHHCGLAWWVLVALGHHPALLPCWWRFWERAWLGKPGSAAQNIPLIFLLTSSQGAASPHGAWTSLFYRGKLRPQNNRLQMGKDSSPSKISTASQLTQSIYWSRPSEMTEHHNIYAYKHLDFLLFSFLTKCTSSTTAETLTRGRWQVSLP